MELHTTKRVQCINSPPANQTRSRSINYATNRIAPVNDSNKNQLSISRATLRTWRRRTSELRQKATHIFSTTFKRFFNVDTYTSLHNNKSVLENGISQLLFPKSSSQRGEEARSQSHTCGRELNVWCLPSEKAACCSLCLSGKKETIWALFAFPQRYSVGTTLYLSGTFFFF